MASTKEPKNEQQEHDAAASEEEREQQEQEREHMTVIPAEIANDFSYDTFEGIAAAQNIRRNGFKNYTADDLKRFTIDGSPVYKNIITDPDTGAVISAEETDEARAYFAAVNKTMAEAIKPIRDSINAAYKAVQKVFNSETIQAAKKAAASFQEIREGMREAFDFLDELQTLEPLLKKELENTEKYHGLTFDAIMESTPGQLLDELKDPGSDFSRALNAARSEKENAETVTEKHAEQLEFPLDKPNSYIWSLLETDTAGQVVIDMLPKSPLNTTAVYSINFDELDGELTITKRLQPFDKRVYIAASALFNAGNNVITLTQLYYAMGNTGKPSQRQLKRINDAVSKMTGARILFDNTQESEALKGKYAVFKYEGSLLPCERITAIVNGQLSDAAIKLFREPPLMTFAKDRQQVTTIAVQLLQSPVNKTDANLLIDDYLIERISKAKNGTGSSERILFKTLYERADIKTSKQRQRAPEKIKKYLTYYQRQGFIKAFKMQKDGTTVYF